MCYGRSLSLFLTSLPSSSSFLSVLLCFFLSFFPFLLLSYQSFSPPLSFSNPSFVSDTTFPQLSVLGRGKFGEVILSKSKHDSLYYAIKKISKAQMCEKKNKESVVLEITSMMRIRHPFVGHLFGYYQNADHVCLVLEYCSGGELFNLLKHRHKLAPHEAMFYLCEIALALDFLHGPGVGIVYRDLKPENVMLSGSGHVSVQSSSSFIVYHFGAFVLLYLCSFSIFSRCSR